VTEPVALSAAQTRVMAVNAALLSATWQRPRDDAAAILEVVRHFGSLQIDPTRTIEKTHYLVLWSRLGSYDRAALDRVTYTDKQLFEHNAFYIPIERLPELRYESGPWLETWPRVIEWLKTNKRFHDSILDQLRDRGALASRDIDDSTLVSGWQSSGWTHGKNTTRMLEFMSRKLEVMVVGRQGQERIWDLPEHAFPPDAPTGALDLEGYGRAQLETGMRRLGVFDLATIKANCYWADRMDKKLLPRLIGEHVESGRLTAVNLPKNPKKRPAWATREALEIAESAPPSRTTLLSPFDRLVYDRERTENLFDFTYKLEMYVPKEERQFGHFTLPAVHGNELVGRLDAQLDRKANVLMVNKLHWEEGQPKAASTRRAVETAIGELAAFVGTGEVNGLD
jgi:uncharacterized protein YcaQ